MEWHPQITRRSSTNNWSRCSFWMWKLVGRQHTRWWVCLIPSIVSFFTQILAERALLYCNQVDVIAVRMQTADTSIPTMLPADWSAISLVEGWLWLFHAATTQMSSTSTITLSSMYAIFRILQDHLLTSLKNLPDDAFPGLREGIYKAYTKLSDYYYKSEASPFYVWAASMFLIEA